MTARIRAVAIALSLLALSVAAMAWNRTAARADDESKPSKEAVARTRESAKMLDDLYKQFVVHITATYVKQQERTPAATIAKRVFGAMHSKGHHQGRLIDATGEPQNPANAAKSDFEKRAVKQIKAGKGYIDEVAKDSKGRPVLRVATVVPVVMKACIKCHPGHKEGDVLGALVYELPIR